MIEILSSILASDLLSVGAEVQRMLDNGVDSLHVDIMDAHFVPNLSFGPAMVSALKKAFPAVHQDVHLMMDNPEKYLDTFISAGAGAVTVHAEVPGDVCAMLAKIRAAGIKAGVSIKPGTGVDTIKEMLPLCDLVLVMTVEPGFGGQKFMADMMRKIAALRELGYRGQIMVDGGINADTAAGAVAAALHAHKAIFLTDVDGLYKDFSDKDSLISNLTLDEVNEMLYGGEVDKGMIPKLRAAVDALAGGVFRAHIINGTTPHSLLLELLTDAGVGTVIHSTETAYEFDTHPHPLSTFAARLTENLDEVEKLQTV